MDIKSQSSQDILQINYLFSFSLLAGDSLEVLHIGGVYGSSYHREIVYLGLLSSALVILHRSHIKIVTEGYSDLP